MGKIFYIFILMMLSTFPARASHDLNECRELEDLATRLVSKMNSFFDMKVKLEFISKANDGSPEGSTGTPLMLMDANAGHATLQMPKPCLLSEESLPSKELWSLTIAHEFSHKIIDQREDKCFSIFFKQQSLSSAKLLERSEMHHINMDVLALKILSETNVNTTKAVADMDKYIIRHKAEIGMDTVKEFEKRIQYMKSILPTDFKSADGFLLSQYFDGFSEIDNYISKKHPKSSLIKDLKQGVNNVDGCFIVNAEKGQQSLSVWKSFDRKIEGSVKEVPLHNYRNNKVNSAN